MMKPLLTSIVIIGTIGIIGAILQAVDDDKKKPMFVTEDAKAIRKAVKQYHQGVVLADRDKLEQAWAVDESHMKFIKKDSEGIEHVRTVPITTALDWWTREQAYSTKGEVLSLDIVDDKMAFVKFNFHFNQDRYIDYLTLYKLNGDWKIVHKSFIKRKTGQ